MKHIKLFEEFSINEAQETLRKKLNTIFKKNKEGMGEEASAEHSEELENAHSDSKKSIKKFFSLMAELEENMKELSAGSDEESEKLQGKVDETREKISDLINRLG
jgi:DNA anti-recombination protein RmuC